MKFQLGRNDPNLSRYIDENKKLLAKGQRMFGVEVYRQLTIATPVDTGRARWGWNCTIGRLDENIPPEAPNHQKKYYGLDAQRASNTFVVMALNGKDPIYISNYVPYIIKLNDGWSQQAPARFFELCFENAVHKMEKYYRGSTLNIT